jgi:4-amino-4-deoxy-L-arabinose transferase-like glycosyltransferase
MTLLKKYWKDILIGLGLILGYFLLRLLALKSLPIFTDEAIYIRWAQIALQDANWRFISLTDGKQPMYIWIALLFVKLIHDPLLAGRLVSVFCGFFTLIGMWVLSYELFRNKRMAFLTALLYIAFPFAQVLDRMALYDSMVGTFAVWGLYLSIRMVRQRTVTNAYTLGVVWGGGVLTKTSALFSIAASPFTLLLGNFDRKTWRKELLRWMVLAGFAAIISQVMYTILRLSPLYGMINTKNATFVYPLKEWIHHPFTYFFGNFHGLTSWLLQYLGISYTLLLIVGLGVFMKEWREKLVLFIYFLAPFMYLALFGKVIFPRFIFFMSLMLLPIIGWGLNFILNGVAYFLKAKDTQFVSITKVLVVILFMLYPLYTSLTFALDPVRAPVADADTVQYVSGWNAGWGVDQSIEFFKKESVTKKIFIGTEGTFGMMPFALEMQLVNNPNIVLKGYWGFDKTLPDEALRYAKQMPAYFVFYQPNHRPQLDENLYPIKLVSKVQQGNTPYYYSVYQIIPR